MEEYDFEKLEELAEDVIDILKKSAPKSESVTKKMVLSAQ